MRDALSVPIYLLGLLDAFVSRTEPQTKARNSVPLPPALSRQKRTLISQNIVVGAARDSRRDRRRPGSMGAGGGVRERAARVAPERVVMSPRPRQS
jgi:hypothetical protein